MGDDQQSSLQELFELGEDDDAESVDEEPALRRFLDPVHDYVVLEPRVAAFVDTKQFQRLRYLKQLGAAYYVFPGAAHNRFEHCLGVAHLARMMVDSLRQRQPKLGITDRDVFCVQVAGLMHDLGHGPFSHVFDNQFLPRVCPGTTWSHEQGSEMMFDAVIAENPDFDIPEDWTRFIKDLIRGKPRLSLGHVPREKPFLFHIVANMENGLDVDKFDYIVRDAQNCGVKHGIATSRFIQSCRAIGDHIAYPHKDLTNIYQVYHTRYLLHKQVYNHKTGKAIEYMVVDALIAADPILKIADKIKNATEYLYLTDSVFEDIERSTDPQLAPARGIIDRIRTRDLYKIVDFKLVPSVCKEAWKSALTVRHIVEEAAAHRKQLVLRGESPSDVPVVHEEDVIVDWSSLHMGMKDKNPMKLVRFYGKHKLNESFIARPDEGSNLIPWNSQEVQISVFARDPTKMHAIQQAYRSLLHKLPDLPDVDFYSPRESTAAQEYSGSTAVSSQHEEIPPSTAPAVSKHTSFSSAAATATAPSTPKAQITHLPSGNSVSPVGSFASDLGLSPTGTGTSTGRGMQRSRSVKEQNQFTTLGRGSGGQTLSAKDVPKPKSRNASGSDSLLTAKRKRERDATEEEIQKGSGSRDGSSEPPQTKPRLQ